MGYVLHRDQATFINRRLQTSGGSQANFISLSPRPEEVGKLLRHGL